MAQICASKIGFYVFGRVENLKCMIRRSGKKLLPQQ